SKRSALSNAQKSPVRRPMGVIFTFCACATDTDATRAIMNTMVWHFRLIIGFSFLIGDAAYSTRRPKCDACWGERGDTDIARDLNHQSEKSLRTTSESIPP